MSYAIRDQHLGDDLQRLREVLAAFFRGLPAGAWAQRTGTRDKDWTLQQATAHVLAAATAFNQGFDAALNGQPQHIDGLTQRSDLQAWNAAEIAKRAHLPGAELAAQIDAQLAGAHQRLTQFERAATQPEVVFPIYGTPTPLPDFMLWHLSHAGVLHAAQLPRAIGAPPLWEHFSAAMRARQVMRVLAHGSVAYWPSYGPAQTRILQWQIGGAPTWQWVAAPSGGRLVEGAHPQPDFVMQFDAPASLFSLFTVHRTVKDLLTSGALRITGDLQGAFALMGMFSATPPKQSIG